MPDWRQWLRPRDFAIIQAERRSWLLVVVLAIILLVVLILLLTGRL